MAETSIETYGAINRTTSLPTHWQYTRLDNLDKLIPWRWERQHVIAKELLDNAIDWVERVNRPGEVAVTLDSNRVFRVKNPGTIPVSQFNAILDFTLRFTSKFGKRSLSRGSLGYGLKIANMLSDLEAHPVVVRTDGWEFEIRLIDRSAQDPKGILELRKIRKVSSKEEVEFEVHLPDTGGIEDIVDSFVMVNPHVQFRINIDGAAKMFRKTTKSYRKDIRLDLKRYSEDEFEDLANLYNYDVRSLAALFLDANQLYTAEQGLSLITRDSKGWIDRLYYHLKSLFEENPVRPILFGERAIKSRIRQVTGVSERKMKYASLNPYKYEGGTNEGRGKNLEGAVEFVKFKYGRTNVLSINGTVLPVGTIEVNVPWGENILGEPVEKLARGKEGDGSIAFIYHTTDQIFKDINKMGKVLIENETIAKLIVPQDERNERKISHKVWINPQWLEKKKVEGYRDEEMKTLFQKQHERLSLLSDEIVYLVNGLYQEVGEISIRQAYYQTIVKGLIFNTLSSWKNFGRTLTKLREWGVIEYDLFEDRTRHISRPSLLSFNLSPEEYCRESIFAIPQPKLDIWESQDYNVELWVEKEALLHLLMKIKEKWRIAIFPIKGFISRQKLYEAYKYLKSKNKKGKKCVILYMGDLDPSGIAIFRALKEKPLKKLRKDLKDFLMTRKNVDTEEDEKEDWSSDEIEEVLCQRLSDVAEIERIALSVDQVEQYSKPLGLFSPDLQEVKMSDTRAKAFLDEYGDKLGNKCYELDTLPPQVFLEIASEGKGKVKCGMSL